jgi:hypothetical protein
MGFSYLKNDLTSPLIRRHKKGRQRGRRGIKSNARYRYKDRQTDSHTGTKKMDSCHFLGLLKVNKYIYIYKGRTFKRQKPVDWTG